MCDATPIRDPRKDSLLTPQNAVLALIDYQPEQYAGVGSVGPDELVAHVGLWTEVCVAFPALDALREGYDVYVVVDAIGGVSRVAHEAALQRMTQAGAVPISVLGLRVRTAARLGALRRRPAARSDA